MTAADVQQPTSLSAPGRLLVDVEEASYLLKCSTKTVRRLLSSGELSSVKVGSLRRIRVRDLTAYADRAAQ